MAESREELQLLTTNLLVVKLDRTELRISHEKTKVLQVWTDQQNEVRITVGNQTVEDVQSFTYLGSVIAGDGGTEADVKMRIDKAIAVFRRILKNLEQCQNRPGGKKSNSTYTLPLGFQRHYMLVKRGKFSVLQQCLRN